MVLIAASSFLHCCFTMSKSLICEFCNLLKYMRNLFFTASAQLSGVNYFFN